VTGVLLSLTRTLPPPPNHDRVVHGRSARYADGDDGGGRSTPGRPPPSPLSSSNSGEIGKLSLSYLSNFGRIRIVGWGRQVGYAVVMVDGQFMGVGGDRGGQASLG